MILTCPECTTKYRFDDERIPPQGLPVRCKRCRTVFRAFRTPFQAAAAHSTRQDVRVAAVAPGPSEAPSAAPAQTPGTVPLQERETVGRIGAIEPPAPPSAGTVPAIAVPITVIPPSSAPNEDEIRRLTRIILDDIVIYGPDKADRAIREGRFLEIYRGEVEDGRKMMRSRFPGAAAAVETYERCLRELLELRQKDLQEAAGSL